MKTALLKTDIWDDDTFFEMHIDTKLVYLVLLSCPERGVGPIYKIGERLLAFRTGLNVKQLESCRQQLEDLGLVYFNECYVYLTDKSGFVQPVKGKLTQATLEKETKTIPKDVQLYFNSKAPVKLLSGSGAAPVHVNVNDNVHVNDIDNVPVKRLPQEATRLAELMYQLISENFEFVKRNEKHLENWAKDIEKIYRIDGHDWAIIEAVIRWAQANDFWKKNIRSGVKLRQQFETLLVNAKVEHDNRVERVTVI